MATELNVLMKVDITESERQVFAYGGSAPFEPFVLVIFRCPSCGSTGKAGSWCEGHSAPMECGDQSLRVKREPVLVPHADPDRSTTELYTHDRGDTDASV